MDWFVYLRIVGEKRPGSLKNRGSSATRNFCRAELRRKTDFVVKFMRKGNTREIRFPVVPAKKKIQNR